MLDNEHVLGNLHGDPAYHIRCENDRHFGQFDGKQGKPSSLSKFVVISNIPLVIPTFIRARITQHLIKQNT